MLPHIRSAFPRRALLACALALLLVACADDNGDGADEPGEDLGDLDLEGPMGLPEPADLDDGVAAVVEGEDISRATVEDRFEAMAMLPEMAEQLDGEQGERMAAMRKAQILQNLVTHLVIAQEVAERGIEPSEEDVAAMEEQEMADFEGDRDEFREALAADGVTGEQLAEEMRFLARLQALREDLVDEATDEQRAQAEEFDVPLDEFMLQEWYAERLANTDIRVDQEYGLWDAGTGEVIPASALEEAP